jgi:hypothetical protein
MTIDWKEVERLIKPSPSYEELTKKILEVLSYDFVKKFYRHNMKEAEEYATRLLGCDPKQRYGEYVEKLNRAFRQLDSLNVQDYSELVNLVETREKLEEFYERANLGLNDLIRVLRYLHSWVLPTKMYLRELIDKNNQTHKEYTTTLRENNIRFTLDILDKCRTKDGRGSIARETGVPEDFIFDLVNRADFTRMPYASSKTVKHYFGGGYNSLEKLAGADLNKLTKDMARYFESIGMKLRRSFIELDSNIAIAKILPKILEH